MRLLLVLAAGFLGVPLMAETARPASFFDPTPDAGKWTLRLHRLPLSTLTVNGDENPKPTPALPSAEADRVEIEHFIRESSAVVKCFLEQGGGTPLPEGFLAVFDPASQSLAVRAPNEIQAKIAYAAELMGRKFPVNLVFNLHVVEAECSLMRSVMKEASRSGSHKELWARIRGLVDQGTVREISILHLDTRSGQQASASMGTSRTYATGFRLSANGWLETMHEERNVGVSLEVDPALGPDGATIDVSFELQHDFAPPIERWVHAALVGPHRVDSQLVDFRRADITTATTLVDAGEGTAKLLGVWAPETAPEPERAGRLEAAFLTADLARVQPSTDNRVLKLLETYGERLLPTPRAVSVPPPAAVPKGMRVQRFHVPMDFMEAADPNAALPADPFARPAAPAPVLARGPASAVEILKSAGVSFPDGASAIFSPLTSELIVQNLPENLDFVEAWVSPITPCRSATVLALSLHVVQADAKTLRDFEEKSRRESDQTAAFRALEDAVAQGKVKFLNSSWFETRSGQRARLVAGTQYLTVSPLEFEANTLPPPASAKAPDAKEPLNPDPEKLEKKQKEEKEASAPEAAQGNKAPAPAVAVAEEKFTAKHESHNVGFDLEVDPVIGPDGTTIDLSVALSYHYAPPSAHEEKAPTDAKVLQAAIAATDFHMAKVLTATTMNSGTTRLLGIWKPEGRTEFQNGDVLQAAFLRVDVLREPDPQAKR